MIDYFSICVLMGPSEEASSSIKAIVQNMFIAKPIISIHVKIYQLPTIYSKSLQFISIYINLYQFISMLVDVQFGHNQPSIGLNYI